MNGKTNGSGQKPMQMPFEVANISRPLASVGKICKQNNQVVFDDIESYILNKKTGEKVILREDNLLYFLDIWVEVPVDFVFNPGFAGQVKS